jgi:colanic acid/amylovoran biosynthesis glycosyltransferase
MNLLHVCGRYLSLSETFTYDLITGLHAFQHHVVATSLENFHHFPLPTVVVPQVEEQVWTLAGDVDARAVVCHFGPQAMLGMTTALAIDRPTVTIFHGCDVSRLVRDRIWVERYRAVARLGMHALCTSHAVRQQLVEIDWPTSQINVIHLGVDTERFGFVPPAERWPAQPRRILMIARLVEMKGVDVALDAMRRLRDRGCGVELRIVGDGPERTRIESLVREWRLTNVSLLGALEHTLTKHELAEAHLYIQPSVTAASGDQEGIPVSLMEAMASGIPVVAARHSGIPELVIDGQTGHLIREGDAEGLAGAIERLMRDRPGADRLAHAARARVEQDFDRRRQATRFEAFFRALAEDDRRRPSVSQSRYSRGSRRGLIIQSVPHGLMVRKLLLLRERYPDVQWEVLTDDSSAARARQIPLVGLVWTRADGRVSLSRIGRTLLAELRNRSYDLVVVPYGDDIGAGCAHVRRAAAAIGGRRLIALTLGDRELPLPANTFRWQLLSAQNAASLVDAVKNQKSSCRLNRA